MSTRRASDILLDLEKKISNIEERCTNIDNNVKLILNRLNLLNQTPVKSEKNKIDMAPKVSSPKIESPDENSSLSTIEQQLLYSSDQKPIILADVRIFDIQTGSMIKKTNTNPSGKWHATLDAGKYRIEIKKGPTANKQGVITTFELVIPAGGKSLPLERVLL